MPAPPQSGLATRLGLTPETLLQRRRWFAFTADHSQTLAALGSEVGNRLDPLLERLYARLRRTPATGALLRDAALVQRLHAAHRAHLQELFVDALDASRLERRLAVGAAHHRVRLDPTWYVCAYAVVTSELIDLLAEPGAGRSPRRLAQDVGVLLRTILHDAALALEAYGMNVDDQLRREADRMQTALSGPPAAAATAERPAAPVARHPDSSRVHVDRDGVGERRELLGLDGPTVARIHGLRPILDAAVPALLDDFYAHLATVPELHVHLADEQLIRLKTQLAAFWSEFAVGDFDGPHAASRMRVGLVHERLRITPSAYLAGLALQLTGLLDALADRATDTEALRLDIQAFLRGCFFDLTFAIDAYMEARAEAVLRSDGYAARLVAGLSAAIAVLDAADRIESANQILLDSFGLGAAIAHRLPLGDALRLPEAVRLVAELRAGSASRCSAVVRHAGRILRMTAIALGAEDSTGRPEDRGSKVALVLDEITDAVRLADRADGATRGLDQLARSVHAALWELDPSSWTVHAVTEPVLDLTGYRDVYFLGRPGAMLDRIPEPDRARFVERCNSLGPDQGAEIRHRLLRADDRTIHVSSHLRKVRQTDGSWLIAGVSFDVTASHLDQQRRIDAVGQLAGGIAHEFNNLLTVVTGNLESLADTDAERDPAIRQADIAHALAATRQAAALTNKLLALGQRQVLRARRLDVGQFLTAVVPELARGLRDPHDLRCAFDSRVGMVQVDREQLAAALTQLVANAQRARRSGQDAVQIELTARLVDAEEVARWPEARICEHVEIAVRDDGRGMPEEVRNQAFDPFFTTYEFGSSRGLGLSVVRGFARQSGGFVVIDSAAGLGTTVRLLLPTLGTTTRLTAGSETGRKDATLVLLVDDEPAVRGIVARMLQQSGFAVLQASSATEALTTLEREPIEVLVTDVILGPGGSGATLGEQARTRWPRLAIVYMSGYAASQLELPSRRDDFEFVAKPFDRRRLTAAVRLAMTRVATSPVRPDDRSC